MCPELELVVFTDRDIAEDAPRVAAALETADAFFASLVFDYDNVRAATFSLVAEPPNPETTSRPAAVGVRAIKAA